MSSEPRQDVAVRLENVGKRYTVAAARPSDMLVHGIAALARRAAARLRGSGPAPEQLWAVRNVNLIIRQGEAVALIGHNGAGKSTILKLLSRITEPTEGRIAITGRVASLLEVGTGFHGDLTCRQNVYLYGAILGMRKRDIAARFDRIVDFAELPDVVDEPVKHLSSGMYLRLAFAVAAFLESEILIVDEVLAVGDTSFQSKCIQHLRQATLSGRTVLFVSHDLALVSQLAERTVLIDHGRVVFDGPTAVATRKYLAENQRSVPARRAVTDGIECRARYRAGGAVLIREIGSPASQRSEIPPGGSVALELLLENHGAQDQVRILYSVNDALGNSVLTGFTPSFSLPSGRSLLEFSIDDLKLAPGDYDFTVSIGQGGLGDGKIEYDAYRGVGRITVAESTDGRQIGYWRSEWGSLYHESASIRRLETQP